MSVIKRTQLAKSQTGATLIVALILLLVMSIIAITSMSTSVLEEKMSVNLQNYVNVFQVAESGIDQTIGNLALLATVDADNTPKTNKPSLGSDAKALAIVDVHYVSGLDDSPTGIGLTGDAMQSGMSAGKGGGGSDGTDTEIATIYYMAESNSHLNGNTNVKTKLNQGFYYCPECQQ